MQKRKIIIGTYDTAVEGLWTLAEWALGSAEHQESYVEVPGHNGSLDISTVLTDGEPYYGSREFSAILESSEGTRMEREERINQMVNRLDGWRFNIVLPDDSQHYIQGRVRVEKLYNDPAHASVRVTAMCDPWRYNNSETVVGLIAAATEQTEVLINRGRRTVVPSITVTGGDVALIFNTGTEERTWTLSPGDYILADIYLKTGSAPLRYRGAGQEAPLTLAGDRPCQREVIRWIEHSPSETEHAVSVDCHHTPVAYKVVVGGVLRWQDNSCRATFVHPQLCF